MATQTITSSENIQPISAPHIYLRLEGLALLAAGLALYANQHFNWWTFALFLLAPDLSMVFYLLNPRIGSIAYNLVHTTMFPLVLALISGVHGNGLGLQIALIWLAHIGGDRALGYGLKYPTNFKDTHLSRV